MKISKLYGSTLPEEKTYVNFIFIERLDHCIICKLIDYDLECIMPLKSLTRKKNIKSLNKLTPLNKKFIGWIEEITSTDIILSFAFVDKECQNYKNLVELNSKNELLKNIFKKYFYKNNLNLNELWEKIIHPIDIIRNELSIFDYFVKNIDTLNLNNDFKKFINESLKEKEKNYQVSLNWYLI